MTNVEATLAQREMERWTMYARHVEWGKLAGYTEVLWNPNQPDLLLQDDTAVDPRFRNRGLGRWLKAAMLKKVLRDRPTSEAHPHRKRRLERADAAHQPRAWVQAVQVHHGLEEMMWVRDPETRE